MRRFLLLALAACASALSTGCATIIHGGGHQKVPITSNPPGASVKVDGMSHGVTPVTVDLKRKEAHVFLIEKTGFQSVSESRGTRMSGWMWGNIVFGGLIGLVVDILSGGG